MSNGDDVTDCDDIYRSGFTTSGVYRVKPDGAAMLDDVYCEMINGTGWTLLQRRLDATVDFNRRWLDYKFGFGSPYGELWIGNERIHQLTQQRLYRLRVELWDWEGGRAFASYDVFTVGPERDKYALYVAGYRGDAGGWRGWGDGRVGGEGWVEGQVGGEGGGEGQVGGEGVG